MSKCNWCPEKCYEKFPNCFELVKGSVDKRNPGNIQELHVLAHRVMPKFFDGLELDYYHHFKHNKVATANWVLSHTRPSGFRVGGIYALALQDHILQTPLIQFDINPTTLSSNVGLVLYPFHWMRFEAYMQRASDDVPLLTQITLEFTRPNSTLTANLYSVRQNSGRGTLSYLQSFTKHLALGTEFLIEWNEPQLFKADPALAARYSYSKWSVAATASRQGVDVSYWQRLSKQIQMASLFAWHRKQQKSIGTMCYQWNFDDSVVRGMIDSDFSVGFSYTRYLTYIPCGVSLSLLISIPTNRFIFGLKFALDPNGLRRGG